MLILGLWFLRMTGPGSRGGRLLLKRRLTFRGPYCLFASMWVERAFESTFLYAQVLANGCLCWCSWTLVNDINDRLTVAPLKCRRRAAIAQPQSKAGYQPRPNPTPTIWRLPNHLTGLWFLGELLMTSRGPKEIVWTLRAWCLGRYTSYKSLFHPI